MSDHNPSSVGWVNPEPAVIARILDESRVIAIVGLSASEEKPSNEVARYLIDHGYDVIPVNPKETEILGRKAFPSLSAIDRAVDVVDVFRPGDATPPIVKEAIRIGARYIWLQLGIVSEESYRLSAEAGVPIVMNKCIKREHGRMDR